MTWIFYIALLIYGVGTVMDVISSRMQLTHGLLEKSFLFKDRYGYFDTKKYLIARVGIFLAVVLIYFLTKEPLFGLVLIVIGATSIFISQKNIRLAKTSREKQQLPVLERLQTVANYDIDAINEAVGRLDFRNTNGRMRYVDFAWFYMDNMPNTMESVQRLADAVFPILWQISRKPKSDWFKDTRMRKLN